MNKDKLIVNIRKSKALRMLLAPFVIINKKIEENKYRGLEDSKIIASYHNTHCGERCFVIGNGPSLTVSDLEKLKNEITFGTNGIFHVYKETDWRPTFYMSMDNSYLDSQIENIKKSVKGRKFINFSCRNHGRKNTDDIVYFLIKGPYKIDRKNFYQSDVSNDVSKYFAQTFSVTTTCIEFAIYMGFTEIYLIGVDNNYSNSVGSSNHFYASKDGFKGVVHYADNQIRSYELYKEFAESHGCKIFNATRGGKLEVYPRVDLDMILDRKKETR